MRLFLLIFMFLGAFCSFVEAETTNSDTVKAEIITSASCVKPDSSFILALKFTIPEGKHTYWKYSGDTGEPTEIKLTLPAGFTNTEILWQKPEIFNTAGFYELGYKDEVYHLIKVNTPKILAPIIAVKLHATWLECGSDCLPAEQILYKTLSTCVVGQEPLLNKDISDALKLVPSYDEEEKIMQDYRVLSSQASKIRKAERLKDKELAASQPVHNEEHVIYTSTEHANNNNYKGNETAFSLIFLIGIAFLGGLILNLMPCVLPVVSLKLKGLMLKDVRKVRHNSLSYAAGIISTFLFAGGFIFILNSLGETYAWGFQMQNPAFVLFLIVLLFSLGLMFSGLLLIPPMFVKSGHGKCGAFASGVLSVLVASPCIAPFMGTAIAFAIVQGGIEALLVFFFMGLGLASPILLLSFVRGWIKYIPKTGNWSFILQKILALPLYLSALWLIWVLEQQVGLIGVYMSLALIFLVILYAFIKNRILLLGIILAFISGIIAIEGNKTEINAKHMINNASSQPVLSTEGINWQPYSEEYLAVLLLEGRSVFIKFGASWCLTCLFNENIALNTDNTAYLFTKYDIVPLSGDFTKKDKNIIDALNKYGKKGVPLYVYYASKEKDSIVRPILLPNIITEDMVREVIERELF